MAIAIGGVRDIDAVNVDTLEVLAAELGMKRGALQRLMRPMVDNVEDAISRAGSGKEGAVLASTPLRCRRSCGGDAAEAQSAERVLPALRDQAEALQLQFFPAPSCIGSARPSCVIP